MTEDELKQAMADFQAAIAQAHQDRDASIARASAEGMKQVDIMRITTYSRETIRQIVRRAGEPSGDRAGEDQ